MVFGRGRETSGNAAGKKRANYLGLLINFKNSLDGGVCFHAGKDSTKARK
jgi:hypothetical protein